MMTNAQLYLSVGLPVIAILLSLFIQLQSMNVLRNDIDKRFDGIDKRFEGVERRFDGVDKRIDGFDNRMDRFEKRMERFEDMLTEMRTTFIRDHAERIVRLESSVFRS
jgi:archaellum component FlaC